MKLSRRALVALSLLAVPTLASCSGETGGALSNASDGGGSTDAADGAFPVTISHLYGETEISAVPQRIVTVSWVNADSLLALDIVPVGMPLVEWGGNDSSSTDWIDAKLEELGAGWDSGSAPTMYSEADGVNLDEMAALTPDLIVAAYSGLTQEDYDQLTKIAPTIGPLAANYTAAWEDVLTAVGQATGRSADAESVISRLQGELAAVGEENPAVAESTFIAGTLGLADNTISLYTGGDTRPRFFTALGMTQAEVITENTEDENEFFMEWSAERADELVSDIFYTWASAGDTVQSFQDNDLFAQIPAVSGGGLVLSADDHLTLSVSAASALSLPWAIENFVPSVIEAAEASTN
ncbi:ABC transporter substrate-binding protein [uncultured Brachybacterium sp.]|uniref:ABC transporter substrate-binding protein n=1 Tax=uncultured Brachybacterium sp. TaxID=189680 RepID=UPI00260419E2|nr:ABC transporter substrate-binding protein [uncultured Brachybacterium sp.]